MQNDEGRIVPGTSEASGCEAPVGTVVYMQSQRVAHLGAGSRNVLEIQIWDFREILNSPQDLDLLCPNPYRPVRPDKSFGLEANPSPMGRNLWQQI